MKYLLLAIFTLFAADVVAQRNLISYDDIKYLLQNNIGQADVFLAAKGYLFTDCSKDFKNRNYALTLTGGSYYNISIRLDGKHLSIEMETNEFDQYTLIRDSMSQFLIKDNTLGDFQSYTVRELGNVYITVNDVEPFDPLRKDYYIQVVGDKNITARN